MWRQARRTVQCPDAPRLDGKLALVTGGNGGIGLEISRGLARRGAEVVIAARDEARAQQACRVIAAETGSELGSLRLDLSDLLSVKASTEELVDRWPGRAVDILVANAGIWPRQYGESSQGHEVAFATNVLGHFVLARRLLGRGLISSGRVVVVTGDIYIMANECTPDFRYRGSRGGQLAYCRSKLGNLWFVHELQHRHPNLEVYCVHPGVIATRLGDSGQGWEDGIKRLFLPGPELGAQTPLICATQPGLARGAYYHNTLGRMDLGAEDPAADFEKARELWERLELLSAGFL
jgi:NAD(P)-dependent dehydrogenase (short-subunit alcohol dehydrogenase family)